MRSNVLSILAVITLALTGVAYNLWDGRPVHASSCQIAAADNVTKGNALLSQGDAEGAIMHYKTAFGLHIATTEALLQDNIAQEEEALKADPSNAEAHLKLSVNYLAMKRCKSAWMHAAQAEELGYQMKPVYLEHIKEEAPWVESLNGNGKKQSTSTSSSPRLQGYVKDWVS